MKKEFFDLNDVCTYFCLSPSTVHRLIRESREGTRNFPLPLFKSGCRILWRRADIEGWTGEVTEATSANSNTSSNNET